MQFRQLAKITQPLFNCAIASSVSALMLAEPVRIESAVDVVPGPLATSYMAVKRLMGSVPAGAK